MINSNLDNLPLSNQPTYKQYLIIIIAKATYHFQFLADTPCEVHILLVDPLDRDNIALEVAHLGEDLPHVKLGLGVERDHAGPQRPTHLK